MRSFAVLAAVAAFLCGGCSGGNDGKQVAEAAPKPELTAEEKAAARNKKVGQFLVNSLFATATGTADNIEANHQMAQRMK